jgi:hypothetical protein
MDRELETNPAANLEDAKPTASLKADDAELAAQARELARCIMKVDGGSDAFWARSMRDVMAAMLVWDAMQGLDRPGVGGDVG